MVIPKQVHNAYPVAHSDKVPARVDINANSLHEEHLNTSCHPEVYYTSFLSNLAKVGLSIYRIGMD